MMRIKTALVLGAFAAPLALASPALTSRAALADITTDTVRQRAQQACYDDVNRLCADSVPDEDRITACMKVNRARLSPGCRKIFNENVK